MSEEIIWTQEQAKKFILSVMENYKYNRSNWTGMFSDNDLLLNDKSPIPPFESRRRVNGKTVDDDPEGKIFLKDGFAHLQSIKRLYELYSKNSAFEKARILDWGVGCGRLIRHVPHSTSGNIYGADVDSVNLSWLLTNMGFGHYILLKPTTKIPVEDGFFDLIYGFSVMTHLSEQEQFFWLEELNRVCRGHMILSVHGPYFLARDKKMANNTHLFAEWLQKGFVDASSSNLDIADVVGNEYYRDTAHTPKYIYENWSRYVDVIDVIPGGLTHDAVICKHKN
jgi:2-polyprenyl-3-methyl-5-hydroxy-6-metoxy-1,4-benzoquinol methylase